jgi:hypothetical protein
VAPAQLTLLVLDTCEHLIEAIARWHARFRLHAKPPARAPQAATALI